MNKLFFDLETIPAQQEWVEDEIVNNISPPKNLKKQESIDKWYEEKSEIASEEAYLKTSFNGSVGEIICIGYAIDDSPVDLVGRKLGESEGDMLQAFIDNVLSTINPLGKVYPELTWIGHYITGFDLHFLWQRMVVNNIKPPFLIPHNVKPWHQDVFDTCHEWKMDNSGFGSLDMALKCLNILSANNGTVDGSKVWGLIQAGEYDKVFNYCKGDVEDVIAVYNRIK